MRTPTRVVWASALAIAAFQVIGSFGAAGNQPERRGVDALALVLVLVGPFALAWRDRWPLTAAGVAIAAADVYVGRGYAYGPIFVSAVVGLLVAAQTGRRAATWGLAAAGYAAFVVAMQVDPMGDGVRWPHLALVAGWLAVVLVIGELVRTRRLQVAERRRAEIERRQQRVSEQRLALAQELHDVLAHNISLINVQASVALHLLDEQPDQARPALTNIKEASHQALRELRTALDALRRGDDAPRAPAPRLADLDALIDGVRASGLEVEVVRDGSSEPLPAPVELAAYRIVQEALTNTARHAAARSVTVRLVHDDELTVEVVDDGHGSVIAGRAGGAMEGNGLIGMRERAESLGGRVDAGPLPGGGFRVVAHLPVSSP
ncbi:MAG: sensor histidine kinase [Ilumatobacteraceae bacterium]